MKRIVLILVVCLIQASVLWADSSDKQIQVLKESYLKLRNTDISISQVSEWRDLADAFVKFTDQHPKHREAASALMNAAILCDQLYRKFSGRDRILLSASLLGRLASEYPKSAMADDALVKRAAILANDLGDEEAALEHYREVIERYPESDMYEVARSALQGTPRKDLRSASSDLPEANRDSYTAKHAAKSGPLIVLDPGHGGEDFGAVGTGGLLEKDVVLAVALELENLLKRELGAVVRLTRRKDVFVPLIERTNLANDFEADLFISLHSNASPNKLLTGIETYYLDNAGDKSSMKLAERENRSVQLEGPQADLTYMLSDLIQSAKMSDSIRLAKALQSATFSFLHTKWDIGRNLGVKRAPFYVLVGAHMPCILIEMGFIDNTTDGANLADKEFRSDLARGLFIGIRKFLQG